MQRRSAYHLNYLFYCTTHSIKITPFLESLDLVEQKGNEFFKIGPFLTDLWTLSTCADDVIGHHLVAPSGAAGATDLQGLVAVSSTSKNPSSRKVFRNGLYVASEFYGSAVCINARSGG